MDCTFCNAPIPPGSRYCPACGASVPPTGPVPGGFAKPAAYPAGPDLYQGPMAPTTSGLAMGSFICGILSWFGLVGIGAILAIVFGHMARREIRESNGQIGGEPLAITGLILGYLQVVLLVLALAAVLFIAGFAVWHG
jgi:hypothetical protein